MSVMILLSIIIAVGIIIGSYLINRYPLSGYEKLSQYECGFEPESGNNSPSFYIKYYYVAVIFLIFDLEAILLYPYTTLAAGTPLLSYFVFLVFMIILVLGLVYEYNKGIFI
jgi:NADH:ubiquinone oxidoreductase subunit 3 (subunit A)